MYNFNIGDYFINKDRYLCKIIGTFRGIRKKDLHIFVNIINTNSFFILNCKSFKTYILNYLDNNNKQVVQILYNLNKEV